MIELLALYALSKRDHTMYGISKFTDDNFGSLTKPSFGAIKPALRRLEKNGFLTSRQSMSDGGKLSVFYSISKTGNDELARLLLENLSVNPLQFFSDARVKLSCAEVLTTDEKKKLFFNIKSLALQHKLNADTTLNNEYSPPNFYQRIILDNTLCEYANFITIIEGLEKDNASVSAVVQNSQRG